MSSQTNRGVVGTIVLIILGFAVVAGGVIFVSNSDSEVANEDEKVEVKDEGDKTMPTKEAEKEKVVGLQFCPDVWIDNQMPTTVEPGSEHEMVGRRDYYRADGVRREISEFDESWVNENCDLERQIVY